jgi:uncharacterized protein
LRETFISYLTSRETNSFNLYFWSFLFSVNDKTMRHRSFSKFCWDLLKCELFYVDGGCQNSGYCCNHLKIKYDQKHIYTESQFKSMSLEHPVLKRFIPLKNKDSETISFFNCSSLNNDNTCDDYDTRPNFCRNYPYNIFIQYDYIRKGCGYKIKLKREFYPRNSRLNKLIKKVYLLNDL